MALEVALRGGPDAVQALEHASARREMAKRVLGERLRAVPEGFGEEFVAASTDRLERLVKETNDAEAATKEWIVQSRDVNEQRRDAATAVGMLKGLDEQLKCLVKLDEDLRATDRIDQEEGPAAVETMLAIVNGARKQCVGRSGRIFQVLDAELAQRSASATAQLHSRFVDAVEVQGSAIEVGRCDPALAEALERMGVLEDAIVEIMEALGSTPELSWALRKADDFASDASEDVAILEWSGHRTYPYDFPASIPLEEGAAVAGLPDELRTVADIANVGARVGELHAILTDQLFGGPEGPRAATLAGYLWTWLKPQLLQSPLVMGSDRPSATSVVPASTLAARSRAAFHLSRWLPDVLRLGDVKPVFEDVDAVLKMVAGEIRAQLLLRARRAVTDFVLDDEDHVLLAPIASPWRPRERRNASWFPSCLVTRTAVQVMEVVQRACADAAASAAGGSEEDIVPATLLSTAIEVLDAYRIDVPILHQTAFQSSLKLQCLYHNDCLMLAHVFGNIRSTTKLVQSAMQLRSAGNEVLLAAAASECQHLRRMVLNSALGDGSSLTHYGTPRIRKRCDDDLTRILAHMQEAARVHSAMLSAGAAGNSTSQLCAELLNALTACVLELDEIAEDACDGIGLMLASAVSNCSKLATSDRMREADADAAKHYQQALKRANAFQEILNIRMEEIVRNAKSGQYAGLLDKNEVTSLVLAIFEDSKLREQMLSELHDDAPEEDWGW